MGVCALGAIVFAGLGTSSPAATGGTVVSATIAGSTSLSTASCTTGTAGVTSFGTLLSQQQATLTSGCTVTYGSTNGTGTLTLRQSDGRGSGMWSPTRGALDPAFDTDGRATTATAAGAGFDQAFAVAVQPDGHIVTAGYCDMGGATGRDFCVIRYTPTGALDTGFDGDGRVTTAIAPGVQSDEANAIAIQSDGRIVVAGTCQMGGTGIDVCASRYNADGSLDTTFDGDGRVVTATAPTSGTDVANAVAVQPDGRIVVAGACDMAGATGFDACLVRYSSTGALDTSFDVDGRVTTAISPGTGTDTMHAMVVQQDGRLVVAGECNLGVVTGLDMCAARYNTNGGLDTSFDSDGRVTTAIASGTDYDRAFALAAQPDGRLVAAGACNFAATTGIDTCLARYNTDGSLDSSFDTDGRVATAIAPANAQDQASGVVVLADGKVVVAGFCDSSGPSILDLCVARYLPNGSVDTSLNGVGHVVTDIGGGGWWQGEDVAVAADGRIVTAGTCAPTGTTGIDFCLAQYAPGGLIDQYDDAGGDDWDTAGTGRGLFGACLQATTLGTPAWTVNATCPTDDGTFWRAVPTTASAVSTANPLTSTATATIRFGVRVADDYPSGDYLAPVTFSVSAP